MKACIQCRGELPDTAERCTYCATVQAPMASNPTSTMMGHPGMARELAASIGAKTPSVHASPDPATAANQTSPMHGAPMAQSGYGAPAPAPVPTGTPPGLAPGVLGAAAFGGANLGIQNAQFGAAAHQREPYGDPGDLQDVMTAQVKPLGAPEIDRDIKVWDESMSTLMLVFGVLLIACSVAPWSIGAGKTVFSWTILGLDGSWTGAKLTPLLIAGTGVVSVLVGALSLRPRLRTLVGASLGLAPILALLALSDPMEWRVATLVISGILLATGLVVRSRNDSVLLARILVTLGAIGVAVVYLLPEYDLTFLRALLDALERLSGKAKWLPILGAEGFGLALFGLALLSLFVWLPGTAKLASGLLWLLLFLPLVGAVAQILTSEHILVLVKSNLAAAIYLPLASVSWMVLASFGLGGFLARSR